MNAPTRLVHSLAGKPLPAGGITKHIKDIEARCCVCAAVEPRTAPADKALGNNFTDRTMFRAPESDSVCEACIMVCSGGGLRTFRLWTIVAAPGTGLAPSQEKAAAWIGQHDGLCMTSKANTRPVIDLLLDPPDSSWLVSVAESGQKHVLPYARVNAGDSGVVRFETLDVPYTQADWSHVFGHALAVRRLWVPAADVLAGTPRYLKTRDQLTAWRSHSQKLGPWENAPLLRLALWTITKGIIENEYYTHP